MALFWKLVSDNWTIIVMNPGVFLAAIGLGWLAGWILIRLVYNQRLAHQQDMIANLRAVLEDKLPASFLPTSQRKRTKRMFVGLVLIFAGICVALIGATLVTFDGAPATLLPKPDQEVSNSHQLSSRAQGTTVTPTKSVMISSRYYSAQNKEEVAGRLDKISSVINQTGHQALEQAEISLNRSPWERAGEDIAPYIRRMDEIAALTIEMHKALYDDLIDKEREYRIEMNAILFPKEPFTQFQVEVNEFRNALSVWMKMRETGDSAARNDLLRLVQSARMSFGTARDKFLAWLSGREEIIGQTRRALRS